MKLIIRDRYRPVSWSGAVIAGSGGAVLVYVGHPLPGVDCFVLAVLAVVGWRLEAARVTRAFKRRRGRASTTVRFTEDGVTTTTVQGASAHRPWQGFSKAMETRDVFVLYVSNGYILIVPKRPFSTVDIERISSLLRAAELVGQD